MPRALAPALPDLPLVDFDWSDDQWRATGQQILKFAAEASTAWDGRAPSPTADGPTAHPFTGSLSNTPEDAASLVDELRRLIPASVYNGHPRFLAYITSSPAPIGVLGDLFASALNQNVGLARLAPAASAIEVQTIDWIKQMLGYPDEAEGLFVSGGQMANVVACNVYRDAKATWDTRQFGMRGADGAAPRMRIYTSAEAHYCQQQAAEMLGMGKDAVRYVPADDANRMRVDALATMIGEDRARGDLPIAIAATAGTVGTGAIDPLPELVAAAREENLWLHVDGAYGAFAALAPSAPTSLRALADADSIACDPHKWLFAPIDAGVTLVRQPGLLERSFAVHPAYLATEGAPDHVDFVDRSPENSRRFRALKVWLALRLYGRNGYRDMIERNIRLAGYMAELVETTPGLVLAAPRELSIVCWRAEPPSITDDEVLNQLQTRIIAELERRGIAFLSNAALQGGRTAIRACIVNFRTSPADVEAIVRASAELAEELASTA
jgi:glutamate/tyrosine decarboxylase-like PLP-dependent enzyme